MKKITFFILLLTPIVNFAQKSGTILEKYGKVYSTEKPDTTFENDKEYKVIFDIYADQSKDEESNPQIEAVIKYLNTSLEQGISNEYLKVAVIFHGTATKNVLNDIAYNKLFNADNPNKLLIQRLKDSGVEIYVDKKSYFGNVYELKDKSPGIKMAYSAMAALNRYESDGYKIINSYQ